MPVIWLALLYVTCILLDSVFILKLQSAVNNISLHIILQFCRCIDLHVCLLKAAKYEIQKTSTCYTTLFHCKFSSMFPVFLPCVVNLSRDKNICCGLKKVVAQSRGGQVYFEQQILALLLVLHQTHNLSHNKFACALANQPIRTSHFFNLQQMFLTKTCNETMLRDKLKIFASRISPP